MTKLPIDNDWYEITPQELPYSLGSTLVIGVIITALALAFGLGIILGVSL